MFSISEEGIVSIQLDLGLMGGRVGDETRRVLGAYAQKIRSDAINLMRKSTPAGRTYTLRIKGRKKSFKHQASAPKQAPARITGRLMGSITVDVLNHGMTMEVGPTVFYGRYLELGTKRMEPRPFMVPALEQNMAGLNVALANAIRRAVRD